MINEDLVAQLKGLKLLGMSEAAKGMLILPPNMRPSLESALSTLISAEQRNRDDKRTARLLKASKLKMRPYVEDVICTIERNLTKETFEQFADCGFIRRGENLIITGLPGCGKTFITWALGHQACMLGIRTLFLGMTHFIEQIKRARCEGTYADLLLQLNKYELLILDDFGIHQLNADTRLALLTIIDDRLESLGKSVIITSQLPFERWHTYLAEPTIADAIIDRISSSSHNIDLTGPTMRKSLIS